MRRFTFAIGMMLVVCAFSATTASADTASVSFTDGAGRSDPAAELGRTWTLSGNSSAPHRVYLKARPTGGAPCAPSAASDSAYYQTQQWSEAGGDDFYGTSVNGNFTLKETGIWTTPGTFMFCIWIADTESQSVTPIRQDVTFRRSTGVISGTVAPSPLPLGQEAAVTITGSSEAPKRVYASIRPAGGAPCATSSSSDSGRSLVDGASVNGAFSIVARTTPSAGGDYLICLWLADSSSDGEPVAGPQPFTFTVVAPPPPCVVPAIAAGTLLPNVIAGLTAANCGVGARRYSASSRYPRGSLIKIVQAAGTSLPNLAPVDILLSSGKPCIVPSARHAIKLKAARARLLAAGCTVGAVKRVKSSFRRRGYVVGFSKPAGTRLSPRTAVGIRVSRGRH
ncbi:MAG: hypothetical protein QOJ35_3303 [Solirubrobacteraceae bacterium]|nr:hypothetical protein [Solirubrobacteraceae bacterium]